MLSDDLCATYDFGAGPRAGVIRVFCRIGAGVAAPPMLCIPRPSWSGESVTWSVNRPISGLEVNSRTCAMRESCASVYGLFGSPSSAFSTAYQ
jgi:hypothetical protein